MHGRLNGQVAVVTGAGTGIGAGIARRFAREGARVVVAERNTETGTRTVAEVEALGAEALFVATDVTVRDQAVGCIEAAVGHYGGVDILVNNAWGGGRIGRIESKTDELLQHGLDVAYYAAFWTMTAALPHMRERGGGSIINVCSLNGVNAHMYTLEYNAGKEALRTLTRTAAVEWGPHQIRCNVICPAARSDAFLAFAAANPEQAAHAEANNVMGRMGDPEEDIGGGALFLASDDARYVNGNTIFADGGGHVNGVSWRPNLPEEPPVR